MHLKHAAAVAALKVMVMGMPGEFKAQRLSRQLDANRVPFVHQQAHSAVNGGDPESRDQPPGAIENLKW